MKILHILAYAHRGGCEKNCYFFIKSRQDDSHQIFILGSAGPMVEDWLSLGVSVTVMDILTLNLLSFFICLKKGLPGASFDKVIVWTNIRASIVLAAINKNHASDIYVHVGNPVRQNGWAGWKDWIVSRFLRPNTRVHLRPVSSFVQSGLNRNIYFSKFPSKVSLKPIQTAPLKIEPPQNIESHSKVIVGMTARLDAIKDHRYVIEAFLVLTKYYPNAILELIGDGPLRMELKAFVGLLGLNDKVVFHGDLADIYSVMNKWNVFLYATTRNEGLGGTIPEALSMGLPVVTTDIPMVREWDTSATFVVYTDPSDFQDMSNKVDGILRDLGRRTWIFNNAPDYIERNFSIDKFSEKYISSSFNGH